MSTDTAENRIGEFIDNGDGTVTDARIGLMWMRCALGQTWDGTICVGEAQGYTWDEAMVQQRDFAGQGDWRLPDIDELKSIVDNTRCDPALDTTAFPKATGLVCWSCSPISNLPNVAVRSVGFGFGHTYVNDHREKHSVRLVRGGQSLGVLNGDANDKASGSPVEEGPVVIQIETNQDVSTNINDSPIREDTSGDYLVRCEGMYIIRAAIDLIKQHPTILAAEIAELRAFLGVSAITPSMAPVEVVTLSLPVPQTLSQIVAWLATLETVALSDLRARLLPLDLLPGAVIDDLNERALDLTGDLALEEDGENFIIVREVLEQVVAAW